MSVGNIVLRQPKLEQNCTNEWRRSFQNRVSLWEQKSNEPLTTTSEKQRKSHYFLRCIDHRI